MSAASEALLPLPLDCWGAGEGFSRGTGGSGEAVVGRRGLMTVK